MPEINPTIFDTYLKYTYSNKIASKYTDVSFPNYINKILLLVSGKIEQLPTRFTRTETPKPKKTKGTIGDYSTRKTTLYYSDTSTTTYTSF